MNSHHSMVFRVRCSHTFSLLFSKSFCSHADNDCCHGLQLSISLSLNRCLQNLVNIFIKLFPQWSHSSCWPFDPPQFVCNTSFFCNTWRFQALWCDSGPGSSCISPSWTPVHCNAPAKHFILAWWIFKPRSFLQTLPHIHWLFVVVFTLLGSKTKLYGSPPHSQPSLPRYQSLRAVTDSPLVTTPFMVVMVDESWLVCENVHTQISHTNLHQFIMDILECHWPKW